MKKRLLITRWIIRTSFDRVKRIAPNAFFEIDVKARHDKCWRQI